MGVYVCDRLMGWWTENLKCAELEAVLAVIWQNLSLKVFLGGIGTTDLQANVSEY